MLADSKYSGELTRHFGAKAVKSVASFGGGLPLFMALSVAGVMGIESTMTDIDTVGTDEQSVVYNQVSTDIDTLTATVQKSKSLFDKREDFETLQNNGAALELLKDSVSFDDRIDDITKELAVVNYDLKDQLKDVIADIYLTGNQDEGLALSETQAQELLSQIQSLDISADSVPKSMDIDNMFLSIERAEHLDEAFSDVDLSSMDKASLSDRYAIAQKVTTEAASLNSGGQFGLFIGGILLIIGAMSSVEKLNGSSRIRRLAGNRPEKPKNH